MNQYFTEKEPEAFTLNRRLHRVGGWLELVHELFEDLFMSSDPDGSVITGSLIPGTDKLIVCGKEYTGNAIPLSNGLRIPAGYEEREYALACRAICIAYGITPCEMSIAYAEAEETEPETETPRQTRVRLHRLKNRKRKRKPKPIPIPMSQKWKPSASRLRIPSSIIFPAGKKGMNFSITLKKCG